MMKQSDNFEESINRWQNIKDPSTYHKLLSPEQKAIPLTKERYNNWLTAIEKEKSHDFYIHMYIGVCSDLKNASFYFVDSTYKQKFPPPSHQILKVPFKTSPPLDSCEELFTISVEEANKRHNKWLNEGKEWCEDFNTKMVHYFKISSTDFKDIFYTKSKPCNKMSLFFGFRPLSKQEKQEYPLIIKVLEVLGANYYKTPFTVQKSDKHIFVDVTTPCPPLC